MIDRKESRAEMLLGDEAIALGAIHAGISGAFAYPGTPSTEIFEYVESRRDPGISARWSTNEKVAFEEALGMSYAGKRALVSMKHVGLNVAADAFVNSGITGVNGGLVLAVADDPGMHSSQNEQDSRFYAQFAMIPCIEPADQQQAYDLVRQAFDISERLALPVMIRIVTRLAHSRAVVRTSPPRPQNPLKPSEARSWILLPSIAREGYRRLIEKQKEIAAALAELKCCRRHGAKRGPLGIICTGIAWNYLQECCGGMEAAEMPPTLHVLGYPVCEPDLEELLASVEEVLVLEDGYPFLEEKLRGYPRGGRMKVHGRLDGTVPRAGELTPDIVWGALHRTGHETPAPSGPLAPRPPALCSGCPHADALEALKAALKPFSGGRAFADIGCYTLGALAPYEAIHSCVDMGASITMAIGAARAGLTPAVAVIGDSTFVHSGMTGLLDAILEDTPVTLVILDNSTVGMTGGQKTAASGPDLERLVKGLGVPPAHVRIVNPISRERDTITRVLGEEFAHPGVSVVIAARICIQEIKRGKKRKHEEQAQAEEAAK
jgi:indolepyruvate ferredoxin oxidoreductase alpha subunit